MQTRKVPCDVNPQGPFHLPGKEAGVIGLFGKKGKKLCLACGQKTGGMHKGIEIEGGWLCKDCADKMLPLVERMPGNSIFSVQRPPTPVTVDGYRAHHAWREECKSLDAVFHPGVRHYDPVSGEAVFEADRENGLFRILRGCGDHADVMRLADVRDVNKVVA